MIFDFAMVGLTWMFIIGFICFAAYVVNDNDISKTKAYKDWEETILNRNEDV